MVKLRDINGNALFRNIAYVKLVNSTDHKGDKGTSIQEEKKNYPERTPKIIYY